MTRLFEQPYMPKKEDDLNRPNKTEPVEVSEPVKLEAMEPNQQEAVHSGQEVLAGQVPLSDSAVHADKQEGAAIELKDAAVEARNELLKEHQTYILRNWEDVKKHDTRLLRFFQITAMLETIVAGGLAVTGFGVPAAMLLLVSSGGLFESDMIHHGLQQKFEKVKSKLQEMGQAQ